MLLLVLSSSFFNWSRSWFDFVIVESSDFCFNSCALHFACNSTFCSRRASISVLLVILAEFSISLASIKSVVNFKISLFFCSIIPSMWSLYFSTALAFSSNSWTRSSICLPTSSFDSSVSIYFVFSARVFRRCRYGIDASSTAFISCRETNVILFCLILNWWYAMDNSTKTFPVSTLVSLHLIHSPPNEHLTLAHW